MNETGLLIRKYRDEKRYTQEFMANRLEMVQSAYQKLESGETVISFERMIKIATVLEKSIENFITENDLYFKAERFALSSDHSLEKEIILRDKLIIALEKQVVALENRLNEKKELLKKLYNENNSN